MPVGGHTVTSYEQELTSLRRMMNEMGGLVVRQTELAIRAIIGADPDAAAQARALDPQVDTLERDVEALAIRLLALRSPMAGDLREIVSALKVTGDLERIGDYAASIAKRTLRIGTFMTEIPCAGLRTMAQLVLENLREAVAALSTHDGDRAMRAWRADPAIDEIYTAMFREFVTYMMEDPRQIGACTNLLFIAKNFERIGDHATNIAERVHYVVTGEVLPAERPRGAASPQA
ncbi:phosphate signaling complex protein PhoU [Novacetimonas pomaceti]|uniref:Phosphate-specific transport system accessory protein PhoU n=1 Tax=Novacetimonas pomaceti TaxID=2021998 RepID=A0A318QP72_9PROT|nr:phosphate signaling complex protein PhoU [Novacetimonas pomaceti]MBV1832856.1 phosphate signaling complex protein PhoU [Novacetimonas pomaceti]PYD76999.1 phosphate transport system regulatory protein PhoU [Novacetimonas pomaceti]